MKISKVIPNFDIQAAIAFLLDDENTNIEKAIKLYSLQIAIVSCEGPSCVNRADPTIYCRDTILYDANMHISLRFMWKYSKKTSLSQEVDSVDADGAITHTTRLCEKILTSNYTAKIRRASSWQYLDSKIKSFRTQCRHTIPVIGYSLDYARQKEGSPTGGITNAILILMDADPRELPQRLRPKVKTRTTKKAFEQYNPVVGLFYVLQYSDKRLRILPSKYRILNSNLLSFVSRKENVLQFIANYKYVYELLTSCGYKIIKIKFPIDLPAHNISIKRLPEHFL